MGLDSDHNRLDVFRFIVRANTAPTGALAASGEHHGALAADAHALGLANITRIDCEELYFIEGSLSEASLDRLAQELLCDPVVQRVERRKHAPAGSDVEQDGCRIIEVALRPGVTDPVAEQITRAAAEMSITGVERASSGQRFTIWGSRLNDETLHALAGRLLANPVIHRYTLGEIEPAFPHPARSLGQVERIGIRFMGHEQLLELSQARRAALDLPEMLAVQAYYESEQRDMTDVEFETIAQTWSEHCVHKTFKASIAIQNPGDGALTGLVIDNLLKTYLKAATDTINAPWVLSAFVDNAGILAFGDAHEVSFKVETHNHPSAIEPFGGANTGVGGVIRDVIGVSAKPIAATDVLCFGPQDLPLEELPAGVLHPRRILSGVVAGVQDYGNKIGIPTVSGAILYDPGYTANPLVFCGCAGIAPRGLHRRHPRPGDRVIVLGGRTGRDGLRGATFSSMTMDAQTGEVAGASVQIGAPITEKGLIDVVVKARDAGLYDAVTDCGAGGLSSAVGEMAAETGADVDLISVRLKYPGLAPWEIWLSEAQERMVLAVPPENIAALKALCRDYEVEFTDIGAFDNTGRLVVRYDGRVVLDLANQFLHDGIPQRRLTARLPVPDLTPVPAPQVDDASDMLLNLLAHPNIASKEAVIRIYDHEVQGGTVIKPLTGAQDDGPSDAAVLKPAGTPGRNAVALGNGINPEYGKRNPYRMAWSAVDEAVRNVVAVGADPSQTALLDNFCWGDPRNADTMGALVECARGCHDAAVRYGAPFISGKDSLNNEYLGVDGLRHAIPPTLLISSIGMVEEIDHCVTSDLKTPGSRVYRVGDFDPKLAGSHLLLSMGIECHSADTPGPAPSAPEVYRALHQAMRRGWVKACHDLSEGGLAVCAAEMCIGGRLGMRLEAGGSPAGLFGETNGCLLVEVSEGDSPAFEALFTGLPVQCVGEVTAEPALVITQGEKTAVRMPVEQLAAAWQGKKDQA